MQEAANQSELVSALADGQLRGKVFARTVEWIETAEDARLTWHAYHLIGDVLRYGDAMDSARDAAFSQRLKLALRQEARLAPASEAVDAIAEETRQTVADGTKGALDVAANASRFHWRRIAGVASLAVVSIIGWQAWIEGDNRRGAPPMAQAPVKADTLSQAMSPAKPPVMIRDPQLDALLAAHKQFGGTSALQVPTGFLRNATFEGADR